MAIGGNPIFNSKNTQEQFSRAGVNSSASTQTLLNGAGSLEELYNAPSATPAQTGRMTYDDVIVKTFISIGVVVLGALVSLFAPMSLVMPLWIVGMLGGLVLGFVNSFKREPVVALILAYSACEGLFLGALTRVLDLRFPGIGLQAVIGTLCVFAVTLLLFRSGKVRATPRAMKFFTIALAGYALFSLANFLLMIFGVQTSMFGLRTSVEIFGIPLGVLVGILAIGLAAFSLIVDFTSIEAGVKNGAPARYAWTGAFGLTVTLVWLYVEIIRLLAILQNND